MFAHQKIDALQCQACIARANLRLLVILGAIPSRCPTSRAFHRLRRGRAARCWGPTGDVTDVAGARERERLVDQRARHQNI